MLKMVTKNLEEAVAPDSALRKKYFSQPGTPRNPQLEMLQAMIRKTRESGPATPSGTEAEENVKKRVKGSDKPNEPKEAPKKQKPEAKAAPIVLKKLGVEKEKARGSKDPAEERSEKDIHPKFFCGSANHKAKECDAMWPLAKLRSSKIPTAEMRSTGKCELFCQICFDRSEGYLLFDEKLKRSSVGVDKPLRNVGLLER